MKITRDLLRSWVAFYDDERIATLVPADGIAPMEFAALDIPAEDRLWVLLREELIPARALRLLACGWAESACRKTGWDDQRSLEAIAVARRFADGEATEDERKAAWSSAWSAVAESDVLYSAAARSAAWSSDLSPWLARNAAEASAEARAAAAWSMADADAADAAAAWTAEWDSEAARAEQLADVVRVLERTDEAAKAGEEAE